MNPDEDALPPKRTGKYIGVTDDTLRYWRAKGQGPPYFKAGVKLVRYRKSDLDKWIEERLERPSPTETQEA